MARVVVVPSFGLRPLPLQDYSVRRCDMAESRSGKVLRLLDVVYLEGSVLSHAWCESAGFAAHFGALEWRSVHRDHFNLRDLHESRYDLVLAKPELMEGGGVVAGAGVPYRMIAQYQAYGSQLVALSGKPELTREWLAGRRLGLLDDPNSVSAYQVPVSALRERGLMDAADIVYFRSYREMYRALFAGRVDAIASILSDEGPESELQLPDGLVLAQNLPGPAWFAPDSLIEGAAYCTVLEGILRFGEQTAVNFFRNIQVKEPCGE
ncbi:MAG: hypothetical protein HKN19_06955 [Halioglobus sp.]|nr:hypothetical protein [Halioglobus sp.]